MTLFHKDGAAYDGLKEEINAIWRMAFDEPRRI
jgi:hypothetical protein